MKRKYSDEVKAAVITQLLAGQSPALLAREYEIPEGTIKAWKSHGENSRAALVATEKRPDIGELILKLLVTELETLQHIATYATGEDWLRKQGAAELATFYGVMQDKTFRKLEALRRATVAHDAATSND